MWKVRINFRPSARGHLPEHFLAISPRPLTRLGVFSISFRIALDSVGGPQISYFQRKSTEYGGPPPDSDTTSSVLAATLANKGEVADKCSRQRHNGDAPSYVKEQGGRKNTRRPRYGAAHGSPCAQEAACAPPKTKTERTETPQTKEVAMDVAVCPQQPNTALMENTTKAQPS